MERQVYARMGAVEDRHWWFVARRRIVETALRRCARLPHPARVLEAGCGTGGNLMMLSRFGSVSAFEPDEEARRAAARGSLFDVRPGHMPDAVPFGHAHFDLAAALDVLEHVEADAEALRAIADRVEPGGWVLLTVPAYKFLWSRHDEMHHHQRRYAKPELLSLAREAGLEPVVATYFNTLLFPLVLALRTAKRLFGLGGDEDALPPRWLNALLGAVFASERHLIGRVTLPFGVSLLMLARRSLR